MFCVRNETVLRPLTFCYSPSLDMPAESQSSPQPIDPQTNSTPAAKSKRSMSRTQKILFFATGWLIVLMPFLFWWNTWFGRHLSDQQLTEFLHDEKKPRHIQHALVQLGDRMNHADPNAKQWYPDLLRLAGHPVEEVRNTDAWVMGQDTSGAGFHEALLKMLQDSSPMVRGNAALSLVRFGDATGRLQIVALLQPAQITTPVDGTIIDADRPGTSIHQGGLIAKLSTRSDLPIGSSPGHRFRAVVSLTITVSVLACVSSAVKPRPRTIGTPKTLNQSSSTSR